MDVVKRSIENLRGEVFIDSETDKGTTITVRLPMTLAIIEGLMVAVSDEKYVIPLSHVEDCIEYEANESTTSQGQNQTAADLIRVRDKLVPFVSLREWFDVGGERPEIEQIVLVRMRDQLFGLCIDHVVGQHQTVIKNLGKLFKGKTGLAGATILGDGGVAMIIDVNQLVSEIQTKDHDDNRD